MTDLTQRLAAILAADAAGYSRLMSLDERATVASLDAARALFRQQIESNRGRVIDMAGDSVLAVFETATGVVADDNLTPPYRFRLTTANRSATRKDTESPRARECSLISGAIWSDPYRRQHAQEQNQLTFLIDQHRGELKW